MIDWFRGDIPLVHSPLNNGCVVSIDADGSIEWESPKKISCRGSWESSIKIRSHGSAGNRQASVLQIDGNISKFLQGHNVFGIRDLNKLVALTYQILITLYPELENKQTLKLIKQGEYNVRMIDINQFYDLGNDRSVESWLHAAEFKSSTRHGRPKSKKGTLYFGKNSRRWSIKFYNKLQELSSTKGHKLPLVLQGTPLKKFTVGKLRAELRLMALQLKDMGITKGKHLCETKINELFNEYIGRIDMSKQVALIDRELLELPLVLQGTYQLWRQGSNLYQLLSKPTYYRHRRMLLEHGIDINLACDTSKTRNVVPLINVITAKPVAIPGWAYELDLIAA